MLSDRAAPVWSEWIRLTSEAVSDRAFKKKKKFLPYQ